MSEPAPSVDSAPVDFAPVDSAAPPVADRQLLERLMEQGGVSTETSRPKATEYVADTVNGALLRLSEWLFGSSSLDETAVQVVQWMIVVLVALLALMLVGQWVRWWRRQTPPAVRASEVEALEPAAPLDVDWRAELERRLDRGDAPAALEALWWWLAERLEQGEAEASWTTRELARRAGRRDLMPLVGRWDRLAYGGGAVEVDNVRGLWLSLRQALP